MSTEYNPYAPPKADLVAPGAGACWREGRALVMRLDGELPHRCIRCNAPVTRMRKARKLYWHHPGFYLLLLFNILIYAIVALIARRTAKVSWGLCQAHARQRLIQIAVAWGMLLGGIALIGVGLANEDGNAPGLAMLGAFGGGALVLAAVVLSIVVSRGQLRAARIDTERVTLKGAHRSFLDSLPGTERIEPR